MSRFQYYTTYVDAHGLSLRVYNGGEEMFPTEFISGCVAAQNERHAIYALGRELNNLKREFKRRHGIEFMTNFSPEVLAGHVDHRVICEKQQKIRSLCRAYYDKYGITYAQSKDKVAEALRQL